MKFAGLGLYGKILAGNHVAHAVQDYARLFGDTFEIRVEKLVLLG